MIWYKVQNKISMCCCGWPLVASDRKKGFAFIISNFYVISRNLLASCSSIPEVLCVSLSAWAVLRWTPAQEPGQDIGNSIYRMCTQTLSLIEDSLLRNNLHSNCKLKPQLLGSLVLLYVTWNYGEECFLYILSSWNCVNRVWLQRSRLHYISLYII